MRGDASPSSHDIQFASIYTCCGIFPVNVTAKPALARACTPFSRGTTRQQTEAPSVPVAKARQKTSGASLHLLASSATATACSGWDGRWIARDAKCRGPSLGGVRSWFIDGSAGVLLCMRHKSLIGHPAGRPAARYGGCWLCRRQGTWLWAENRRSKW